MLAAPAMADVKAGVDAWSRGDYKAAVEQWRPAAIAGDPDAQFDLGQAYKLGRGVPVDLALAEQWYGKAALQGHVQAEDNYGLTLFQNGKKAEAVPWLEKSAGRGEPRAQLVLGTMLFNGDAVKKDWVRAYTLVVRSNASGLPQAATTLAQMDSYIPADLRQQGTDLARQYEASSAQLANQGEVAGQGSTGTIRPAELPASRAADEGADRGATLQPVPPKRPASRPKPQPVIIADAAPAAKAAATPSRPPVRAVSKGWRFQVGAFRDEGNARNLWQQIEARVGDAAGLQPYYLRSGTLTKLQIGNLASSADVARVCGAVKARIPGTPCVPVAP
ncbi:MAG: SPOR domain-containing protein [Sphingomonas sp.]